MASTSYKTRIIFKEHTGTEDDITNYSFAGTYNLLVKSKTIPSPLSPPNTVESTTLN